MGVERKMTASKVVKHRETLATRCEVRKMTCSSAVLFLSTWNAGLFSARCFILSIMKEADPICENLDPAISNGTYNDGFQGVGDEIYHGQSPAMKQGTKVSHGRVKTSMIECVAGSHEVIPVVHER